MPNISIDITITEENALRVVCESPQEWAENAVKNRARIAIDEIVQLCVTKCLEESVQVPSSIEEIVELALTKGWVESAEERNKKYEDSLLK